MQRITTPQRQPGSIRSGTVPADPIGVKEQPFPKAHMRTLLWIAAALSIVGCAASYHEPTLPADHPANPSASSAAIPESSHTLLVTEQSADRPPSPGGLHKGHGASPIDASPRQPAVHEHTAAEPSDPSASATLYVCPMHPETTSGEPDQRCPKCGMKLVKKDGGK